MGQCRSPSVSPSRQAGGGLAQELSLFQLFQLEGNPFEMHIEHKEEETEDVLASNGVSEARRSALLHQQQQGRKIRPEFDDIYLKCEWHICSGKKGIKKRVKEVGVVFLFLGLMQISVHISIIYCQMWANKLNIHVHMSHFLAFPVLPKPKPRGFRRVHPHP